jgi:UDP-glucose 6-dehydrogenase
MEKLTTTFNQQMSELLKRLVQENFQELNNSVKLLNVWQVENKQQVATLTEQFKQIVNDFEKSSTAIKNITMNTEKLTSNESYLVKLIKQLQAVMIDDVKFVEITKNLTQSAVILDETSEKLVKWTQNDYEFHTAAKLLIAQLDQMKDINNGFWQSARTEMNKVVKSIDDATHKYQTVLSERDNQFANWLTTTLKNMDKVMERHIENTFK